MFHTQRENNYAIPSSVSISQSEHTPSAASPFPKTIHLHTYMTPVKRLVHRAGLEPATSRPPDACANQLRYIPFHERVQKYTLIVKRPNFQPFFSSFTSKNMSFQVILLSNGMHAAANTQQRDTGGFAIHGLLACKRP